MIERARPQPVCPKARNAPKKLVLAQHLMAVRRAKISQKIVNRETQAYLERRIRIAVVNRNQERHRPRQVRRKLTQQPSFAPCFAHQTEFKLLKIAQAAVDQLGRTA